MFWESTEQGLCTFMVLSHWVHTWIYGKKYNCVHIRIYGKKYVKWKHCRPWWQEGADRHLGLALGWGCCGNCFVSTVCIWGSLFLRGSFSNLSAALATFLDSSSSFRWILMTENTIRKKSDLKTRSGMWELPEIGLWKLGKLSFPQPMNQE